MTRSSVVTIGIVVLAGASFAALVPERREPGSRASEWMETDSVVAAEQARLVEHRRAFSRTEHHILHLEARAAARTLPRPQGERLQLRVAPAASPEVAARYRHHLEREFASLGDAPGARVLVWLDGPRAEAPAGHKHVVLPEVATGDSTCVVLINHATPRLGARRPAPGERLLGLCGFVARFGPPGPGMLEWLDASNAEGAVVDVVAEDPQPTPSTERVPLVLVGSYARMFSCRAGRDASCEALFDSLGSSSIWSYWREDLRTPVSGVYTPLWRWASGRFPATLLADLRRTMGDERFARLWQDNRSPALAYRELMGSSVGPVVRTQLATELPPHAPGPLPSGAGIAGALALIAAAAGWLLGRTRRQYA